MNRQKINLISATVSIVLALQAFIVVLLGITTGWDRGLADEGPGSPYFPVTYCGPSPLCFDLLSYG
jgi:hypothetical protein